MSEPREPLLPPPLEPPVTVPLVVVPPVPCPYLPGREETIRAIMASTIPSDLYTQFMDRGFRRSGRMIYQPICAECRECVQIRVIVPEFAISKSQRRCFSRNQDLRVTVNKPQLTAEKLALYSSYVTQWHKRPEEAAAETLERFLYDSPTQSIEFEYRQPSGKLLAIGICDLSADALSSVYFYFDPAEARRSLGTFGAVHEIAWCAARGISRYYLGYYIRECDAMSYKASFRPFELLNCDGTWRRGG